MKALGTVVLFCLGLISLKGYTKPLMIGTQSYLPPFETRLGKGRFYGFDIEIMTALCKEMKVDCKFKSYHYNQFPSALASGEIDLAIAGIIISPDRRKLFLFSSPYKINYQTLVVLKSSNYETISQLEGKKIGVYRDSPDFVAEEEYLHNKVTIKHFFDFNEMVAALKDKKVDALLVNAARASYWLTNESQLKAIDKTFRIGDGFGIAAKPGNSKLIKEVNLALDTLEKNGVYLKIYRAYFN